MELASRSINKLELRGNSMNIKKAAYDAVTKKLNDELASINSRVSRNKYNFKVLAEEQTKLKRQRGILCDLLNDLKGRQKKIEGGN